MKNRNQKRGGNFCMACLKRDREEMINGDLDFSKRPPRSNMMKEYGIETMVV